MLDILYYGLPTNSPASVRIYKIDLMSNYAYGSCEGIYLDLWIGCFEGDERRKKVLGIFKTLDESDEAMPVMSGLLADYIIEEHAYVNANLDDFAWTGMDVRPFDGTGKPLGWKYTYNSKEPALKAKDGLLEKYLQVAIRDNAARKDVQPGRSIRSIWQ